MRVHPGLLEKEKMPAKLVTKEIWKAFQGYPAFESYLANNGTLILEFFLHIPRKEQQEPVPGKLEEPAKKSQFGWAMSWSESSGTSTWRPMRT